MLSGAAARPPSKKVTMGFHFLISTIPRIVFDHPQFRLDLHNEGLAGIFIMARFQLSAGHAVYGHDAVQLLPKSICFKAAIVSKAT